MTVCRFNPEPEQEIVIAADASYATPLLPGYELPLARLLELADRWVKKKTSN